MHRYLPAPPLSLVHFGIFTVHFYALAILLGIFAALWLGRRRYKLAGGNPDDITDVAIWTIPAGIVGGRLYHVITSPDAYFGSGGHPIDAFKIWQGGMGIWGAVAVGVGISYLVFKRSSRSLSYGRFADALAPALLLAQAIGRWGNWFNNELFGKPTNLPWGLEVPLEFRPAGFENYQTFHPTFLYESLWCILGVIAILTIPRLNLLKSGKLFIGYIAFYCLGRLGCESLRIDQAHLIGGVRINIWVSLLGLCLSTFVLLKSPNSREKSRGKGR
ncbi:MAG: prolipoprotein diacylglyceryl transferase [Actinomycetes bacterium]